MTRERRDEADRALAPGTRNSAQVPSRSAGPRPRGPSSAMPSSRARSLMVSSSSSLGMTSFLPQPHPSEPEDSPTGMYSMKRTCSGRSMDSLAKPRNS